MEKILHIATVFLFFAIAVWYLYRRFKNLLSPGQNSCGCGGCGGCADHTMQNSSSKPVHKNDK